MDLQIQKNLDLISIQHSHIKDIAPFAFPIICKDEEKRSKRQNIVISAAALSAVAVFGIIFTL